MQLTEVNRARKGRGQSQLATSGRFRSQDNIQDKHCDACMHRDAHGWGKGGRGVTLAAMMEEEEKSTKAAA